MIHQSNTPTPEPPRRYVVQSVHPSPPTRTVRVVRRRVRTPPPPASVRLHSGPRRQINSDTEVIQRQQRMRRDEMYDDLPPSPPILPEMYHIETPFHHERQQRSVSPVYTPQYITPSPKSGYQGDRNRRQNRVQPLSHPPPPPPPPPPMHNPPEPTVVRRVYKKLSTDKQNPPNENYIQNENHPPSGRKPIRTYQAPKQYHSSPQVTNRNDPNSGSNKNPSIYYLRSVNDNQ